MHLAIDPGKYYTIGFAGLGGRWCLALGGTDTDCFATFTPFVLAADESSTRTHFHFVPTGDSYRLVCRWTG